MKASFDNTDANQTKVLNSTDPALKGVKGTAWATVVDKQVTREVASPSQYHAGTDNKAGKWTLSVKSDDALQQVDDAGNKMAGKEVPGAKLTFSNTKSAQTQDVYGLTGQDQDASYISDVLALATHPDAAKPTVATSSISTTLAAGGTDQTVATADAGQGMGANVYGWMPTDIKLTMPQGFKVNNGIYKANLTWTLTSDVK